VSEEIDYSAVVIDDTLGTQIADAYMAGPDWDPCAIASYRVFMEETTRQFDFLTRPVARGGLGVDARVCRDDPYQDFRSLLADVRDLRVLKVYATAGSGNEHPYLTTDENDMFRAVHDAFGHAATGRGFDRHGEEAAFRKRTMYSSLATVRAGTETRARPAP
jgi:hypothetical protein